MQQRASSRLLLIDDDKRVLLFRFEHKNGPLAGQVFWATPGGGLDEGESYADAARRELFEETGLRIDDVGSQAARRIATFALPSGEIVEADERYFIVQIDRHIVSNENWTDVEREVMSSHQWWSQGELHSTRERVWPEGLTQMLVDAGIWKAAIRDRLPELD